MIGIRRLQRPRRAIDFSTMQGHSILLFLSLHRRGLVEGKYSLTMSKENEVSVENPIHLPTRIKSALRSEPFSGVDYSAFWDMALF